MLKKRDACLVVAVASLAATANAQSNDDASSNEIEELIVTAHPLSAEGLSQAATTLTGEELERKRAESIGATLASEPGIHSAAFGTAVGRPVVHGLGGPRVKIMEDRIDTMDVSVTSADHAVSIDPFVATRVEVLKGSSTLLYGSGAIGGVVDVHTGRIPHSVPDEITGGISASYDDNHGGTATVVKLNGGGGNFAWHIDATSRDGDDAEIPGSAESALFHAREEAEEEDHDEHEEEGHDDEHEEDEVFGVLPGSHFDNESFAFGASIIDDWGLIGVSVARTEGRYGLPGGHSHGDEHHDDEHDEEEGHDEDEEHHDEDEDDHGDEGTPILELEQTRVDIEAAFANPFDGASSLNIRMGINDYEHAEIEPNGEVATLFKNEAWEARAELVYGDAANRSIVGTQMSGRDFSAVGEEAFIAPVQTDEIGIFWIGERSFDGFDLEFGARIGNVEHDPSNGQSADFTPYALSVGAVIPMSSTAHLGLLFDHSTRAPIAEELYSDGPHLVTQSFELGDASLDREQATNMSATLHVQQDVWQLTATAYVTQFGDFIYAAETGLEDDGLPVFQYTQDDAVFVGLDAQWRTRLATSANADWYATAMMDWVHAELDRSGNDAIPRLPPMRIGVGIAGNWQQLAFNLDLVRAMEQDEVTVYELPSAAYTDLRASIEWTMQLTDQSTLRAFLRGTNLTDDEQRRHTSFIKDLAPSPGRAVSVGLRWEF